MDTLRTMYVKANEFARGQTMTEYAMIMSAIAVVCYAGYQALGTGVSALVTSVNTQL